MADEAPINLPPATTAELCTICYTNELLFETRFAFKGCDHSFCTECVQELSEHAVKIKQFNMLQCPEEGCGYKLTRKEIYVLF